MCVCGISMGMARPPENLWEVKLEETPVMVFEAEAGGRMAWEPPFYGRGRRSLYLG